MDKSTDLGGSAGYLAPPLPVPPTGAAAMVDRLAELRGRRQGDVGVFELTFGEDDDLGALPRPRPLAAPGAEPEPAPVPELGAGFMEEAAMVRRGIAQLQRRQAQTAALHSALLQCTTPEEETAAAHALEQHIDTLVGQRHQVSAQLKALHERLVALKAAQLGSAEERACANAHNQLVLRMREHLQEATAQQSQLQAHAEQRSAEEASLAPNQPQQHQQREALQREVGLVHQRHAAILSLERNVRELHQLFLDMAMLVERQGDQLDCIEDNVQRAVQYTERGVQALVEANELGRRSRQKLCCLLVIFVLLLFFLLGPLLLFGISRR